MRRSGFILGGLLLLLLAAMALGGALLSLPPVRQGQAAGQFDANRAVARLQRVLGDQRPHPVDTPANDAVRDRIVAELRAIGLNPQVTDDFVCNSSAGTRSVKCARVRNVLATIGPARGRHVLVASHYDSVPVGPGASDDGIGVSVMLETAALLSKRKLARPVAFLFDEGEETGLIGARAFVERNPLAANVDALVNIEARGVSGPATMFETDSPNGAAISHFARAVRYASANSLATDMAKLIPNSTDVEVMKERHWTTLNFAIIGNETRYHSAGDTVAALDRRSVQQMGDEVSASVAELANGAPIRAPAEKIYGDVLGGYLIVLPRIVGLAGVAVLLGGVAISLWRRRLNAGRVFGALVAALIGSAGLSFAAQWLAGLFRAGQFWRAYPDAIAFAVAASALAASVAALLRVSRPIERTRLRPAFWLLFLVLGALICAIAPGGAIYFLLPPLVALGGMAIGGRVERGAAILAALILFLTWAPLLALAEILLDFGAAWPFAPVAALIMLPWLIELAPLLSAADRRRTAFGLAVLTVAAWALAASLPAYSADRKQQFGIEYVGDQDGRARWMVVNDGAPLPPGLQAMGRWKKGVKVPWSTRPRWALAAPGTVAAPSIEELADTRDRSGRRLSLKLHANGAYALLLHAPADADLRAVRVDGSTRTFGPGTGRDRSYLIRCEGRACDGMRVDLLIGSPKPVNWTLIGSRSGLPPPGQALAKARPVNAEPQYTPDATIGVNRLRL